MLPDVPGTRSVFAERVGGGYFLDFDLKREQLARYGLSVDDAQMVVMNAIGGDNVGTTIEGRERYPINVRYYRDSRSDLDRLSRALVPAMDGKMQIPLAEIATLKLSTGPSMLRNENGMLNGYVYVDVAGRDVGSYVAEAKRAVRKDVALPAGYTLAWSGQYEAMERVRERLKFVLPLTLFLIFLLLYLNTQSTAKTLIVLLAVPFSAIGAIWLLYLLGYNMSIGVWVGLIALMGVDAETGVFMLLYLELAFEERRLAGRMNSIGDLREAITHGAVKRIRPKVMTVATMFVGLAPDHVEHGRGSGRDEAHRRPDDRRHLHFVSFGTGSLSGNLRGMEMAIGKAAICLILELSRLGAAVPGASRAPAQVLRRHADRGRKRHSLRRAEASRLELAVRGDPTINASLRKYPYTVL